MRKKLVLLMILAAALVALPALAQNFGANPSEQPNAAFQSTSTLTGSGSQYSANPTLNNDGTAAYAAPSGPRRAKMDGPGGIDVPPIVVVDPEKDKTTPLRDTLLPLLFMSLSFCGYLYLRRKRSEA